VAALTVEDVRVLLCELGAHVRDLTMAGRAGLPAGALGTVEGRSPGDTIYGLDRIADDAMVDWFSRHWPSTHPVRVVTEALDTSMVLPAGATPQWTCIVDPVDGTRGLMYDKRSAWVLAAAAPNDGTKPPRLRGLLVAAMTEIPPVKQQIVDQLSGVRGCGRDGIVSERHDLRTGEIEQLAVRPSTATDLVHGWASFTRFLPQGKALSARFEERLLTECYGGISADLAIFDDQYLATGGQLHELLVGHDRLLGDLRPLAHRELGLASELACHPYDCCTALLLEEAGCVVTDAWGAPLDAPLDTTTPIAWIGYANAQLAERFAPAIRRAIQATFPSSR